MDINQLKEDDHLKLYSKAEAEKLVSVLKHITLEDIVSTYLKHFAPDKYNAPGVKAVLSSFLNGEPLAPSLNDLKLCLTSGELSKLGHSLRITHLETFYPPIMELCKNIYKEQNILLTCGVYITPNENAQCFLYHCDYQHILAYQIAGEKRWSFPKIKNECLREYDVRPVLNQLINEGSLHCQMDEITLKANELLFVPYAVSHRACNDADQPSVHLTFAEEDITSREVMSFMAQEIVGIKNFDGRFFEEIDFQEIERHFPAYECAKTAERASQFFIKTKMLKFKFGTKAI